MSRSITFGLTLVLSICTVYRDAAAQSGECVGESAFTAKCEVSDVIVILDATGSMGFRFFHFGATPFEIAQAGASDVLSAIPDDMRTSVIVLGDRATELSPLCELDPDERSETLRAIKAQRVRGHGMLADAFRLAGMMLEKSSADSIPLIVAFSDGRDCRSSEAQEAVAALQRRLCGRLRCEIVGILPDASDSMALRAIAEAGGGSLSIVETSVELRSSLINVRNLLDEVRTGRTEAARRCQEALADCRQASSLMREQLDAAHDRIRELKCKIRDLERRVSELTLAVEAKNCEIQKLSAQIESQKARISELERRIDEDAHRVAELEAKIVDLSGDNAGLRQRIALLESELASRAEQIKDLETRLDAARSRAFTYLVFLIGVSVACLFLMFALLHLFMRTSQLEKERAVSDEKALGATREMAANKKDCCYGPIIAPTVTPCPAPVGGTPGANAGPSAPSSSSSPSGPSSSGGSGGGSAGGSAGGASGGAAGGASGAAAAGGGGASTGGGGGGPSPVPLPI